MGKSCSIEDRTDHLGNIYSSMDKMCKAYGISAESYSYRIKKGMSKEEALTRKSIRDSLEERTDHLGNVFDSQKDMCRHYNVNDTTYRTRIKSGFTKEQALTASRRLYSNDSIEERTDHLGNVYNSITEMCDVYNIDIKLYRKRINSGFDKERALIEISKYNESMRTDHLGNVFKSKGDMLEHWKVSKAVFDSRKRRGYTLEQCLTGIGVRNKSVSVEEGRTDHLGILYNNTTEMCNRYGVPNYHMKNGMNMIEKLKIIPQVSGTSRKVVYKRRYIFEFLILSLAYRDEEAGENWYFVEKDNEQDILSETNLIEYAIKYSNSEYKRTGKIIRCLADGTIKEI